MKLDLLDEAKKMRETSALIRRNSERIQDMAALNLRAAQRAVDQSSALLKTGKKTSLIGRGTA